jgi:hypothetical protein
VFKLDSTTVTGATADAAWVKTWSDGDKKLTLKRIGGQLLPYDQKGATITFAASSKTKEGADILASSLLKVTTNPAIALVSSKVTSANRTPATSATELSVQVDDTIELTFNKAVGTNSVFVETDNSGTLVRALRYTVDGAKATIYIDTTWAAATNVLTYTVYSAADTSDSDSVAYNDSDVIKVKSYAPEKISLIGATGLYTTSAIFGNETVIRQRTNNVSFSLTFDRIPAGATPQVVLIRQDADFDTTSASADLGQIISTSASASNNTLTISYSPATALNAATAYVVYVKIFDGKEPIFDSDDLTGSELKVNGKKVADIDDTDNDVTVSINSTTNDAASAVLKGIVFVTQ